MLDEGVIAPGAGKRAQTKAANRLAILDAARGVFGEMGYEAASVRDVIRRSGLSVGAFYNYYRSKEEVFQALWDDGARRFRLILRAEYQRTRDFDDFLRVALFAFFSFQVSEHEAWRARRLSGDSVHPHIRIDTPEMKAVFEEVKALIADRIERGAAPRVDADYLAAACLGIARELAGRMLARRPPDVAATTDFAIKMIKGGIGALPHLDP